MSTRCNIRFCYGNKPQANIYRHCDGYPTTEHGVLADLKEFFREVQMQTEDTRFSDPSYLAAKFVVWQAGQNSKPGSLDFLSVGIVAENAADGEYVYTVDCTEHDDKGYPKVTYRKV